MSISTRPIDFHEVGEAVLVTRKTLSRLGITEEQWLEKITQLLRHDLKPKMPLHGPNYHALNRCQHQQAWYLIRQVNTTTPQGNHNHTVSINERVTLVLVIHTRTSNVEITLNNVVRQNPPPIWQHTPWKGETPGTLETHVDSLVRTLMDAPVPE